MYVGSVSFLCQHVSNVQVKGNRVKGPSDAHPLAHRPSHPVRPVDQIQVAHPEQRPLVCAPVAALDADEPVVGAFGLGHDGVRVPERAQQRRSLDGRAVREVVHVGAVRGARVELVGHVSSCQLRKGCGAEARPLEHPVQPGEVQRRDLLVEEVVGKGTPAMRRGDGYEGGDSDREGLEVGEHVPSVQAAHAVCDDGDGLGGGRVGFEGGPKGGGAIGDG